MALYVYHHFNSLLKSSNPRPKEKRTNQGRAPAQQMNDSATSEIL